MDGMDGMDGTDRVGIGLWRYKAFVLWLVAFVSVLLAAASGCQRGAMGTPGHEHDADQMPPLSPVVLDQGEKLRVVATTSLVADVVQNVGGDRIALRTLMPLGADPHSFEPTPQDAAAVADAHVVFVNGVGLEAFLEPVLESAGQGVTVVPVSYGVELLQFTGGRGHQGEEEGEDRHGGADPHTWFDPHNVIVWTHNVAHTLSALDPANAGAYGANASAYQAELQALDAWIGEQVAQVPVGKRKLVTDHALFGYFARRYGFEQVGALFPGYSTLAEPSAQDLVALEDAIRAFDVRAVFVGLTINPDLAERVAGDTGTQLVYLYTGSLGEAGGLAGDYVSFMRYDVSAIVEALR
jgi:manganese/iron transport system substrate-binding protein